MKPAAQIGNTLTSLSRSSLSGLAVALLCACAQPPAHAPIVPVPPASSLPQALPLQVIVKPATSVADPSAAAFVTRLSAASGCQLTYLRVMGGGQVLYQLAAVSNDAAQACVKRLNAFDAVEFAELDALQRRY